MLNWLTFFPILVCTVPGDTKNTLGFKTDYGIKEGIREIYQALTDGVISDNIKTKTVEWYKHLLNNSEDSKKLLVNDTLF